MPVRVRDNVNRHKLAIDTLCPAPAHARYRGGIARASADAGSTALAPRISR